MPDYFTGRSKAWIAYKIFVLIVSIGALALTAFSQTPEKCFRGAVRDAAGAVVVDAEIVLKNAAGKTIDRTVSDAAGEFVLGCVEKGAYTLLISKNGMATVEKKIDFAGERPAVSDVVLETAAVAETVTVNIEPDFVSSTTESATKTATALRDVPQSVEIVNRRILDSQAAFSLKDALFNVTAVAVAQGEGRRDQFVIRGFSAVGDQFIDGVRDDALYYRDLSNIEQIEVVKGPAAVLFGRGSSGGIINRTTKKPNVYEPLGSAEVNFGSYGLKRGMFDYGRPIFKEKLAFRFVGAYEDEGSFRAFYYQKRYNVAPSLAWKPDEKTDVTFQFEFLSDKRRPDRGIPSYRGRPVDVPAGTYYGFPGEDRITSRVSSQALRFERQLNPSWTLRNVFRRIGTATDFYNTVPGAVSLVGGGLRVARSQYDGVFDQTNYFDQTEAVGAVSTGGVRHTLLAGVEFGYQTKNSLVFRNGTAASVALVDPVLTRPVNTGVATTDNNFRADVFGVYFQDQISINRYFKALVGARFDNFKQKLDDFLPANADLGRTDRQWSPRAGLVYQPNDWLSFYASYTRSFQPSGENLSLAANNAELKPEMTRNYETGVKAAFQPFRLNATLAVFRLDRDNIKTTDPLDPTRLILVGEQRTDGLELTVSGAPLEKLDVVAGYSLLDARILKSNTISGGVSLQGKIAPLTPRSSGNLWLTYGLPRGFRLGFGGYARSKSFTSANNLVTLPGYARLDASLAWRGEKHYEIALNLKNVLNRRYYETSNGDNNIMPGAPVSGSVTFRYRW
ncbi:MAG: TonB-dependent siderophore receptor [Acidobacteria bacterium]|nr:TonB-dependent siderophore receptor [Acidobacteriota bacterium]